MSKTSVVIPNWNGAKTITDCLNSLKSQVKEKDLIIVDNASHDGSVKLIEERFPQVTLLKNRHNLGFTGGVNTGIRYAIEQGAKYVALFNNDAVADKAWLKTLISFMEHNSRTGIATSKIVDESGSQLDSTGEAYTIWGLPYPRGRGETDVGKYDNNTWVFGASGAASIYRAKTLQEIGLFDQDFFAYYEDVDISFRAQLAGWKVAYVPGAVAYHKIGTSSAKVKDFTTYQTLKNLPMLMWKNVPWSLMPKVWPRLVLAYSFIAGRALLRGQFWAFFKGVTVGTLLLPKKLVERYKIQKNRKVSTAYIDSIITHDLPPSAQRLRNLRRRWWKIIGKDKE